MSDYIDKWQLIEKLDWDNDIGKWTIYDNDFGSIPTADVAPSRHGYLMDSSNGWTCSECCSDNIRDTKWCPNCGAKMDRKVPD